MQARCRAGVSEGAVVQGLGEQVAPGVEEGSGGDGAGAIAHPTEDEGGKRHAQAHRCKIDDEVSESKQQARHQERPAHGRAPQPAPRRIDDEVSESKQQARHQLLDQPADIVFHTKTLEELGHMRGKDPALVEKILGEVFGESNRGARADLLSTRTGRAGGDRRNRARVRPGHLAGPRVVTFSREARAVCPSCLDRRTSKGTTNLVEPVLEGREPLPSRFRTGRPRLPAAGQYALAQPLAGGAADSARG